MIDYILECEGETRQEAEEKSLEILELKPEDIEFQPVNIGVLKRIFKNAPVVLRSVPRDKKPSQEVLARGIIHTLLYKLNIEAKVKTIEEEDGNLYMLLESEQSARIIGKHGRALDSLQFLLNLLVNKWTRQKEKRIILDVSSYRTERRKSIHAMCERVADKVARSGRSISLNYMSPYERRIVHLFLEEDKDVYTESMGVGVYKRVQVLPYKREGGRRQEGDYSNEDFNEVDGNAREEDEGYYEDDNRGNYDEEYSEKDDAHGNYKEDYDDNDDNDESLDKKD